MAKRNKKLSKSLLKLESLEQRQLLAGIVGGGTEVLTDIHHANGNVYDQVLMTGASVQVTADAGQVTRVSFLDMQGDIVQAEFSGSGTLTISLDNATTNVDPTNYLQSGVKYVQGVASFSIQGSDATTNFLVFSVGKDNAVNQALFDDTHTGGNHTADVARITIVADPSNPNGSIFGGIRAGNAVFTAESGVVGITAAKVQVQDIVRIGDIDAKGSATPALVFGVDSQFGSVEIAGGDLLQTNGKAINNSGSYAFQIAAIAGTDSSGTTLPAKSFTGVTFTDKDPISQTNKTFTLTALTDTFTGGAGDDTFNATDSSLTAFDKLDGGDGNDTLNLVNVTGTVPNGSLVTVTGIENLAIQSAKGAITTDVSDWTGLKTIAVNQTGTPDAIAITTKANADWISIKGGTTVGLTDSGGTGADKLATVVLDGNTGAATITSDVLTSLSLANTNQSATITAAAGTRALELNLNAVTGGTIADAEATSVKVTASGSNSSGITLSAAKATSVTIDAAKDLTLTSLNAAVATTVTISGAGKTTLSALATAKLATIDASGTSGGVVVTPSLGTDIAFTGGSGKDSVTVGLTTKAISMGDGDDTVVLSGAGVGTGGSISGGAGTDTLSMTATNANTTNASKSDSTFATSVTGFEKLVLTGGGTNTIDLSKLGITGWVDASGATAATLNKFGANGTLSLTAATTAVTVSLADATGSSDVLNIALGNTAGTAFGTVTASGVETVNINSDDTATTATGITHSLTLVDTAAKTIKVTGDAGLTLTHAGTALTLLDASAVTKDGAVTFTSANLAAAATIKTGAGNDVITVDNATTKAVTIEAGDGDNTISAQNGLGNTITSGKGDATITVTGGNNTITTGEGDATITAGGGNNTITLGKGTNTVTVGNGNNTIVGGSGDDTITFGTGLNTVTGGGGDDTFHVPVSPNGNIYSTITDAGAGDVIVFATDKGTEAWLGGTAAAAKITLAGTASFDSYLNAAAAGNGGTNGSVAWFQFGGDTYVVYDVSASTTAFVAGADTVVKLSGLVELKDSTIGDALLTIV